MFGRLAPRATLREAQAELSLIGERTAAQFPETNDRLRPEVARFGPAGGQVWLVRLFNLPFLLFLIVVSANVATLLYARTATRATEIALRSALGASRARIVVQLIAEAFVLTAAAALLGLTAAGFGLRRGMDLFWEVQQTRAPFWWNTDLSATTVLYVVALALLGASIIGGIPGARATGRQLRNRLTHSGGGEAMRFGAVATGVIIVQVALCVAFIPVAIINGRKLLNERTRTDFPAERFLTGRIVHETAGAGLPDRRESAAAPIEDVFRRIEGEPGVAAATRFTRLPGFNHPVEAIGIDGDSAKVLHVRQIGVDANFFDVVGARITNGRGFVPSDATSGTAVAIADEGWASTVFNGRNPIGQRIRYPSRAGDGGERWYEIVGVVSGMKRAIGPGEDVGLYHPIRDGEVASVQFYLRTNSPAGGLVARIQTLGNSLDRTVGITDLAPLDDVWRPVERANGYIAAALTIIAAVILLFALIGIYALMSFTVARRSREIGIRAALGANPRRIIAAIFRRAMLQVGLGIVAGAALVSLTIARSPDALGLVAGVAASMAVAGLIGAAVPAMRALRIQPTDALRAE
jgi:predicted permease